LADRKSKAKNQPAGGLRNLTPKKKQEQGYAPKWRATTATKPLPPPVDITTQPGPVQQSSEPKSGGLFGMFKEKPLTITEAEPSPAGYGESSTSSYSDPEAQRLIDSIPDTIAPEATEPGAAGTVPGTVDAAGIIPTIPAKLFKSLLSKSFGWAADWRKRECYRLKDEDAETLTDATLPVLNPWLAAKLEQLFGEWAAANPGMVGMVFAWSTVVGPMIGADMAQTAAERIKKSFVREGTSHSAPEQPKPQPVQAGGMLHDMGEAA
jgi:hypothetical protein